MIVRRSLAPVRSRGALGLPLVAGLFALAAAGCSNDRGFGNGQMLPLTPVRAAEDNTVKADYVFRLRPQKAGLHSKDAPVGLVAEVGLLPKGTPLTGPQVRGWKVTLLGAKGNVLAKEVELGDHFVMLDAPKLEEPISALFEHPTLKAPGRAQAKVLFDLDAPAGTVTWWPAAPGGRSDVRWTFSRVEDVDAARSAVVVCADDSALTAVSEAFKSQGKLPEEGNPTCRVIATGPALADGTTTPDPAAEELLRRPDARVVVLARDAVGNVAATQGQKLQTGTAALVLEATSPQKGSLREAKAVIDAGLFREIAGGRKALEGSDWIVTVESTGAGSVAKTFDFSKKIELGPDVLKEGRQIVTLRVAARSEEVLAREGLRDASNEVRFEWIVDSKGPALGSPMVSVPSGQLQPDAQLTVQWAVQDDSGVATQVVEYRSGPEDAWKPLQALEGDAQSIVKTWPGAQKQNAIFVRVRAIDVLGNETISAETRWREQIFNLAVLTKSVECFWCHMKIVGDVGSIFEKFGSDGLPKVHQDAGSDFRITGKFFSNVAFPGGDMPAAIPEAQREPNYQNNPMPVFPKDNMWPALTTEQLRPKMNGLVRGYDPLSKKEISLDRFIPGNLVLVGTEQNPIRVSGEVLVEGDLVIAGVYKGLGTIYAKNIFIANDLKASNSAFPFPDDQGEALAKAKQAVADKKDGLYLAALNDVVVGSPESMWSGGCTEEEVGEITLKKCKNMTPPTNLAHPYAWLPKGTFQGLGRRAEFPLLKAYHKVTGAPLDALIRPKSSHVPDRIESSDEGPVKVDDLSSDRNAMEVGRVDAFLYAGRKVQARPYWSVLINGGVMSPNLELLSTIVHFESKAPSGYRWGDPTIAGEVLPTNPSNGIGLTPGKHRFANEIRFDWRLRAGGGGLEVLKEFFE